MSGCKTVTKPLNSNKALKKEDGSPQADSSQFWSLIGILIYLTSIRLDIMYTINLLPRFLQSPTQVHYKVAKRKLKYLEGTKDYDIWYELTLGSRLLGYINSNWVGSVDDMKSTSRYAFMLGSWIFYCKSNKQVAVTKSLIKAEYIAVHWLQVQQYSSNIYLRHWRKTIWNY